MVPRPADLQRAPSPTAYGEGVTAIGETPAPPPRRTWVAETFLVLGVSLGASGIYSVLNIIDRLTVHRALRRRPRRSTTRSPPTGRGSTWPTSSPTSGSASSPPCSPSTCCPATRSAPGSGSASTSAGRCRTWPAAPCSPPPSGFPAWAVYAAARALGLNTTVAAANLTDHWWAVPVLVLAAAQNAVLEEVVMVGYLYRRWLGVGWTLPRGDGHLGTDPRLVPPLPGLRRVPRQCRDGADLRLGLYRAPSGSARSWWPTPCSTSWPSSATRCSRATCPGSSRGGRAGRPDG